MVLVYADSKRGQALARLSILKSQPHCIQLRLITALICLQLAFISQGENTEVTCCCDSPEQHCNAKFAKPVQIYPEQEDRVCKFRCKIDPLVKE